MTNFRAKIIVKIKPDKEDKRSEILEQAIEYLMPIEDLSCKAGDVYYLNFSAKNQCEALHLVEEIASEVLINDLTEGYEIRYLEVVGSES